VNKYSIAEQMDDIRAVMDAVGSEKAVLFGHSEGSSVSALLQAPIRAYNRLDCLWCFANENIQGLSWAPTDVERESSIK
jgi:hypothetical protein